MRPADISEAPILSDFMTQQAVETENKTLDQFKITNGVKGLFDRPHCGKYYVAVDVNS